jgi:hypothetical protein
MQRNNQWNGSKSKSALWIHFQYGLIPLATKLLLSHSQIEELLYIKDKPYFSMKKIGLFKNSWI